MKFLKKISLIFILSIVQASCATIESVTVLEKGRAPQDNGKKVIVLGTLSALGLLESKEILERSKINYCWLLNFLFQLQQGEAPRNNIKTKFFLGTNKLGLKGIKSNKKINGYIGLLGELVLLADKNRNQIANINFEAQDITTLLIQQTSNLVSQLLLFAKHEELLLSNTNIISESKKLFLEFQAICIFYGLNRFITIGDYLEEYNNIVKSIINRLEKSPGVELTPKEELISKLTAAYQNLETAFLITGNKETKLLNYLVDILNLSYDIRIQELNNLFQLMLILNKLIFQIDYFLNIVNSSDYDITIIVVENYMVDGIVKYLTQLDSYKIAVKNGKFGQYQITEVLNFDLNKVSADDFCKILGVQDLTAGGVPVEQNIKALEDKIIQLNTPTISKICGGCNKKQDCPARCGHCKIVYYCDRSCQATHWVNSHAKECLLSKQY